MSDEKRTNYLLRNHQSQPIELHLPDGVVVIGPRGEREVAGSDLSLPQVRALARARVISSRAVTRKATEPAPPESSSPSSQPNSPTSRLKTKTPAKEA